MSSVLIIKVSFGETVYVSFASITRFGVFMTLPKTVIFIVSIVVNAIQNFAHTVGALRFFFILIKFRSRVCGAFERVNVLFKVVSLLCLIASAIIRFFLCLEKNEEKVFIKK